MRASTSEAGGWVEGSPLTKLLESDDMCKDDATRSFRTSVNKMGKKKGRKKTISHRSERKMPRRDIPPGGDGKWMQKSSLQSFW